MSDRPLILVVSPDPANATKLCAGLALAGWDTVQAEDLLESLEVAKTRGVSLVILQLPPDEMLRMDLPRIFHEIDPSVYLPTIIFADDLGEQCRCRLFDDGVGDIVSPQISVDELLSRVRSLLRMKELNDQLSNSRAALQESLARERKLLAELRNDNEHLQILATTDPLTRVQNVRSFESILTHSYNIAKRYNQPLSLLMLDLDHFKLVNDNFGHPSGDYVLKELAVILQRSVRDSDVVSRIGGEEFSIILPKADRRRAALFAARICREVKATAFKAYRHAINLTISIGSASHPADAEITDPQMLVYAADQALLASKNAGRNRVVAFCDLAPAVRRRMRWQYEDVICRTDQGGGVVKALTAGR